MKTFGAKKHLALLMVLILCAALVCGCQSTKPVSESATDAPESAPADLPASSTEGSAPESIKLGFVLPLTGPMANFTVGIARAAELCVAEMNAEGGYYIKEYDKKIPVEIIWGDSESSPTKASEVAAKLATKDQVNILFGEWTPETANPVSVVGERYKIPTLVCGAPDSSWLVNGPYEWSYAYMFSYDNFVDEYFNAFDTLDTNKKIGLVMDSGVDGVGLAEKLTAMAESRGYEIVDPGRFPENTTDYSAVISQLKEAGCDIMVASLFTPQHNTLWNQCLQLGYQPSAAVLAKGMQFSADASALGAPYVCTELEWSPQFPYASSLLGMTGKELSDDFEEAVGDQADITIGWDYACFDIIDDVLSRAQSLDASAIRDAMGATDLDTAYGHVKFAENHVTLVPIGIAQWVPNDTWGVTKNIIAVSHVPELVDLQVPLNPITYK